MNIKEVKTLLEQLQTGPKKKFGQNFLVDNNVLSNIVNVSKITKDTNVIEIGPGLGSLTDFLAVNAKKVLCYEIDTDMINVLNNRFKDVDNVNVVNKDFLQANINEDIYTYFNNEDCVVVANLPYYITTAILVKILEETTKIKHMTVMMQTEVAKRICGKPDTKDYNGLSVLIQYYTKASIALNVKPTAFYPQPNVDSTVISLEYLDELPYKANNEAFFKRLVRALFYQRRKTVSNNLKAAMRIKKEVIEEVLSSLNFSQSIRAEQLTIEDIIKLSNKLETII